VYVAGVRNNFIAAIFVVFILQIIGLLKKRINFRNFLKEFFLTPLKLAYRFLSFCVACVTFGNVDIGENRLLVQTGNIHPIRLVRFFLRINILLFAMNLFPIHPLDGGKIADIFSLMIFGSVANIPSFLAVVIFLAFFIIALQGKHEASI
jgi:Zn-dependent protease